MRTASTINKKRVAKARKKLHVLQEKIAPYVKPRKYKPLYTRGRWRNGLTVPPHNKTEKPLASLLLFLTFTHELLIHLFRDRAAQSTSHICIGEGFFGE